MNKSGSEGFRKTIKKSILLYKTCLCFFQEKKKTQGKNKAVFFHAAQVVCVKLLETLWHSFKAQMALNLQKLLTFKRINVQSTRLSHKLYVGVLLHLLAQLHIKNNKQYEIFFQYA